MAGGAAHPLNPGSGNCSSTYGPSSSQAFIQSSGAGGRIFTSAYNGPGGTGRIQVFSTDSPHPVWVDVNSNLDQWSFVMP
jgi:hypothetical protein